MVMAEDGRIEDIGNLVEDPAFETSMHGVRIVGFNSISFSGPLRPVLTIESAGRDSTARASRSERRVKTSKVNGF